MTTVISDYCGHFILRRFALRITSMSFKKEHWSDYRLNEIAKKREWERIMTGLYWF